ARDELGMDRSHGDRRQRGKSGLPGGVVRHRRRRVPVATGVPGQPSGSLAFGSGGEGGNDVTETTTNTAESVLTARLDRLPAGLVDEQLKDALLARARAEEAKGQLERVAVAEAT